METLMPLVASILSDHGEAITSILILLSGGIGWLYMTLLKQSKVERDELIKMFQHQIEADRKELIEIIEKYHEGQINVVQAIGEIKLLIATLGAKL
jgi:hypothetical protein